MKNKSKSFTLSQSALYFILFCTTSCFAETLTSTGDQDEIKQLLAQAEQTVSSNLTELKMRKAEFVVGAGGAKSYRGYIPMMPSTVS